MTVALSSLGFAEIRFMSIGLIVADLMTKQSPVKMLGFDTSGGREIVVRIQGQTAAVSEALEIAERRARELGSEAIVNCLSRPADGFEQLYKQPNQMNAILGARDQMLPTDYPEHGEKSKMNHTEKKFALGILETQGMTALLEATDVMLKAADVSVVCKEKIGAAYVTVVIKGDVAAVSAAIDAGREAVSNLGTLIAAHVIARPHDDIYSILPV